MDNKKNIISIFSTVLLMFTSYSYADNYSMRTDSTEIRLNTGYLTGKSGEYVYDAYGLGSGIPGYKVSQLDWKIDSAYMVGLGASFSPTKRIRLNADYWRDAVDGQAQMDDYDWLYVGLDWSHWSHSADTKATEISNVNVNGEFTFLKMEDEQTDFTFLLGYKRDHLKWVASGGYGIYSIYSYRDALVVFPDIPGITYEQTYSNPYIGLGIHSANDSNHLPIVLNASILYSSWVRGEDADTHHLRNLYFQENGDGGKWFAANVGLDFYLTRKMALTFAYTYQKYGQIKASTTVTDQVTGNVSYYPGPSAGLDHSDSMISGQLSYHF